MLCYARRRGLGLSEIHDRCEIIKLMVQLKVLPVFLEIPEYPCDLPMDRHPDSKGTEMIHARNFRVQPQAIMGSSIVE